MNKDNAAEQCLKGTPYGCKHIWRAGHKSYKIIMYYLYWRVRQVPAKTNFW